MKIKRLHLEKVKCKSYLKTNALKANTQRSIVQGKKMFSMAENESTNESYRFGQEEEASTMAVSSTLDESLAQPLPSSADKLKRSMVLQPTTFVRFSMLSFFN